MSNKTVSMVKEQPIHRTSMKETPVKEKQPISKIELMHKSEPTAKIESTHKSVVISPNSAVRRSIKITPTITNQKRKLKSVFGFQSQAETLKLISRKALLPLGYSHSNRFYLT